MVLEIGDRGPYSPSFVGFYFQDLFSMACSILVHLLLSLFSMQLVNVHVMNAYSCVDTTADRLPTRLGLLNTPTTSLLRGKYPTTVLVKDTKQSDVEVPAMLELWKMWSTSSLPLLSGPLWPGMVAHDRAQWVK